MNFAEQYRSLLRSVLEEGYEEKNIRTGIRIKALAGGTSFKLNLSNEILPTCGLRKTRPYIAAAELAWCLQGHDHIRWLQQYTKTWNQFADSSGQLRQAYGHRWRTKFGIDQLTIGLQRLKDDPTDRRVWISSWDAGDDIRPIGQKTVPCPVGFTLSTSPNRLNSTFVIRSSDLFYGLPYDVMRHAYLMAACVTELNLKLGFMLVTLAHPHLYEPQWEYAKVMVEQPAIIPEFKMPKWTMEEILKNASVYVDQVKMSTVFFDWPKYNPKSEVVG